MGSRVRAYGSSVPPKWAFSFVRGTCRLLACCVIYLHITLSLYSLDSQSVCSSGQGSVCVLFTCASRVPRRSGNAVVEPMTVLCRAAQQVHGPPVGRGGHGGEIHRIHRGECGLLVQGGWRCVPSQALCGEGYL